MDDELNITTNRKTDPAPICPHCLQDPARISIRGPILLGTMIGMVIFCGNPECRKIWAVEIVGSQDKRVQPVRGILQPPS